MWVKQPRPTPSAFLSLLIRGAYSSEMNYTWSFWWYHWPLTPTITVGYMKPIVALMGYLRNLPKNTRHHPSTTFNHLLLILVPPATKLCHWRSWKECSKKNVPMSPCFVSNSVMENHSVMESPDFECPWPPWLGHGGDLSWQTAISKHTLNVWYIFNYIYLHFPYITLFV